MWSTRVTRCRFPINGIRVESMEVKGPGEAIVQEPQRDDLRTTDTEIASMT